MSEGVKKGKIEKRGILVYVGGGTSKEVVKLRRDATIFGRDKADIIIDDPEVSATHCQIQNIDETYHLFDMNSTNGTFVNNERIVKAKLKEGDVITLGKTSFKFALEDEKNVRHIPTLFRAGRKEGDRSSIVDTLIESELRHRKTMLLVIKVTYGNGEKESFELNQKLVYLGRATSFGRFDQDPEISRKHLLIKLNDTGEIFIEDQNSTNGSFLNGQKITGMHPIKPTDVIKVGECMVTISLKQS